MNALDHYTDKQPRASGMARTRHLLPGLAVAVLAFAQGTAAWGQDEPNEISECDVFIEINATDEDAGWQGILDASAWKLARIIGPEEDDDDWHWEGLDWETKLIARAAGSAADQGITEYQWESAEPTFDEFALAEFLERFPAGVYKCKVRFITGHPWRAKEEDELTHCLPDGPEITDPGELMPGADWTVMWDPVTTQYDQDDPGLGDSLDDCDPEDELVKYSVTLEFENGVEKVMTFDVLPQINGGLQVSPQTAVVSGDFLECGLEGKVEIGAFLDSGNSTFREIEIATEDCS